MVKRTEFFWNYEDVSRLVGRQVGGAKSRIAGRYSYTYEDIAALTGLTYWTVNKHKVRGILDPSRLESLVVYFARYGVDELQDEIVDAALHKDSKGKIPPPDNDEFRTIIVYIARHGVPELQEAIVDAALRLPRELAGRRSKVKPKPRTVPKIKRKA